GRWPCARSVWRLTGRRSTRRTPPPRPPGATPMSTPPTTPMYDAPPDQPPRVTLPRYRLLAFFLGAWGVHNFVAGHTRKATIPLALGAGGLVLSVFLIGVPILLGAFVWALVDLATVTRDGDGVLMDTATQQARAQRTTGSASPIPSTLPA